ncbi:MAG: nucleotidyltransferase domain-containing protein [Hyphomicrobiales bacterium]|nr:nucleotidyltransferase domain-containing protein [Hyphomicrobiales bacterium]
MLQVPIGDPILRRFRAAVSDAYGARLDRIVLYGSRARGDARPDSDYDVAVFLRDVPDHAAEFNRLADITTDILYEEGGLIHAMPFPAAAYDERTPLMHEIREDGVDL